LAIYGAIWNVCECVRRGGVAQSLPCPRQWTGSKEQK